MTTPNTTAVDTTNTEVNTDATNVAPAAPAAPVVPSKMDKAKVLFAGLNDGTIALAEGKSARATFIAAAQLEDIGMTKNGAATYWQNLVSAAKGGKLYPHTAKTTKKADATPGDAAPAAETAKVDEAPAGDAEGTTAKDPDDVSHLAE